MAGEFHYGYSLSSLSHPDRHYIGYTTDLQRRFRAHNAGSCFHTIKFAPWRIEVAIAFRSRDKALSFERYLKSHSGRAFALRHF